MEELSGGVPQSIIALVERFNRNEAAYKSQGYNELQLRQEFINPFFEALGWDVYNKGGAAPAYRDVIHEDSIKMAGGTKAPDYCFTLSGRRMFFVETKKPAVDVTKDTRPAYQLRRYAWSAGLVVSILMNFEQIAVYESRQKPKENDKVATERILLFSYKEFVEKWQEIAGIFSKQAVLQGSFDKFIEAAKQKRGTQEVGDEFLREIEGWREELAKNIALRNPDLSVRELNNAVQHTIDRIIFLRMCEDRGIERYGQLHGLLQNETIYQNLCRIYEKADEKYNSGLFHFKREKGRATPPDELTLGLKIDDKVLEGIIKHLYYPESPYEFSVLRPEILGNVYEQFLGKVIRLTEGHHAKVEEKPEVKKAGGVFYTPQYIVEYIVKNTVGKLCEGKTPKQIEKIHILDPACGSGSFLLGAYTYLLNYHLDFYSGKKNPRQYKDQIYQRKNGQWFLTIKEKKRILLNNIFGVDIDNQAVEVTKLSLLLKVLEGEGRDVFEQQKKLFQDRVLPDLINNIKCGNSLIGLDFNFDSAFLQEENEEIYKVNAFDWNAEFKEIMDGGGFDVVIGNPPYVRQETLSFFKGYFEKIYVTFHGIADLYVYFIEKGIKLLNDAGHFSFIVSNKWLRSNYGAPLREWIKEQGLEEIIDFGDLPVFQKATTYPCIIKITKGSSKKKINVVQIKTLGFPSLSDLVKKEQFGILLSSLSGEGWSLNKEEERMLLEKIKRHGKPLKEYINDKIFYGIKTGFNDAFIIDKKIRDAIVENHPQSEELIKPFLVGKDIKRYEPLRSENFLILIPKGWTQLKSRGDPNPWLWLCKNYPQISEHLSQFEQQAERRSDKGEYWWELRACEYYEEFEKPKIMLPDISLRGNFALDDEGSFYCVNTAYILASSDRYLLGILNSSLVTFYYASISSRWRISAFYLSVLGRTSNQGNR